MFTNIPTFHSCVVNLIATTQMFSFGSYISCDKFVEDFLIQVIMQYVKHRSLFVQNWKKKIQFRYIFIKNSYTKSY